MAARNFETCIQHILKEEGGYVNDPRDPGGETNYGITRATARNFGYQGSMLRIPLDTVRSIYRKGFWDAIRADELPSGLDLCLFDYGVNSGPATAVRKLQGAIGRPPTGKLNDGDLRLISTHPTVELISEYCALRMSFLRRLKTWPVFGKGWTARVARVKLLALKLAGNPLEESKQ